MRYAEIMKKIIMFYIEDCPYCLSARKAITELKTEYPPYTKLLIQRIDETAHPEIAEQYDYYHVPTFFVDGKKAWECSPKDSYKTIKENVKAVLDSAL